MAVHLLLLTLIIGFAGLSTGTYIAGRDSYRQGRWITSGISFAMSTMWALAGAGLAIETLRGVWM